MNIKKCTKCSNELKVSANFCDECGEKVRLTENGDIDVSDVIVLQRNMKKDIDFEKSDDELSPDQLARKLIYNVLDEAVEKSIGKDKKEEIDELGDKEEFFSKLKENLLKLTEIGKEIEKNLFRQKSHLIIFFEKGPENYFKTVVNKITDEILEGGSLTNSEKSDKAKEVLQIVEIYREKMLKELISKQEIVKALLPIFEKKIDEINFEKCEKELGGGWLEFQKVSLRWLELTKYLVPYRGKVIEAVKESLEMEEVVPRLVIKYQGDTTKTISGTEMFAKGDRVVKFVNEANEAENKTCDERTELSQWLFGTEEEYMDFLKNDKTPEMLSTNKSIRKSNGIKWAIVIVLSIVALSGGIWTAIGVFVLGMIIINILSK